MARLKISAPWVLFYRKIEALFKNDPEVRVIFDDEESCDVKLYVENAGKADALMKLLPTVKDFGNVLLTVTVIPANGTFAPPASDTRMLIGTALAGNGALSYIHSVNGIFTNGITYVVFKNEVVQYFADDLGDVNGLNSTLYQELAKEVFGDIPGVFFCTDVPGEASYRVIGDGVYRAPGGSLGRPLGEWP